MIQTLKRQLGVMRIDPANIPYKLASEVAKIVKTLRITPHGVTKILPFEAHMCKNQILLFQTWQQLVHPPILTGKK